MNDLARLREIERLLDDTTPTGPYRSGRRKLRREQQRIIRRMSGEDPRFFATGVKGYSGGLTKGQKELAGVKAAALAITKELEDK